MKLNENQIQFYKSQEPCYFARTWLSSEIVDMFSNSSRIAFLQELIAELWRQNPTFKISDIKDILRKNNTPSSLIKLIIWDKNDNKDEWNNVDNMIEYLISQNPNFTKEEIIKKMNSMKNRY